MKRFLPIFFIGLLFWSCGEEERLTFNEQLEADEQVILDYLTANNIDAEQGDLGLYYVIEEPGVGDQFPNINSTVIVNYRGYFPDGTVFDEGQGFQITLRQTIGGWQVGIPLFKKGGKGQLFIPSGLGYGQFGNSAVPGNQVLIFDVELINFL